MRLGKGWGRLCEVERDSERSGDDERGWERLEEAGRGWMRHVEV